MFAQARFFARTRNFDTLKDCVDHSRPRVFRVGRVDRKWRAPERSAHPRSF
jgi:hypothetical protein